jgi:predicted nucleic-acid-binding Zn-ribbon protein
MNNVAQCSNCGHAKMYHAAGPCIVDKCTCKEFDNRFIHVGGQRFHSVKEAREAGALDAIH